MQREEVARILAGHEKELREKFGVRKMALFDAFVKGPTYEGDVDVMAEFEDGTSVNLFDIVHLQDYLDEVLGENQVNLAPTSGVTPRPRDMIRGEPLYVLR